MVMVVAAVANYVCYLLFLQTDTVSAHSPQLFLCWQPCGNEYSYTPPRRSMISNILPQHSRYIPFYIRTVQSVTMQKFIVDDSLWSLLTLRVRFPTAAKWGARLLDLLENGIPPRGNKHYLFPPGSCRFLHSFKITGISSTAHFRNRLMQSGFSPSRRR